MIYELHVLFRDPTHTYGDEHFIGTFDTEDGTQDLLLWLTIIVGKLRYYLEKGYVIYDMYWNVKDD